MSNINTRLAAGESSRYRDVNLHDTITAITSNEDTLYPIDKLDAHERDIQHLAVSIFIFHSGRLLLQRRAETKYHSGGLWTNSVCSHPRWQEPTDICAKRRLQEEIGLSCDLTPFGVISYRAQVGKLFEHERVHCYVGYLDDDEARSDVAANPQEVVEIAWVRLNAIDTHINNTPEQFTEWFKIYMGSYRDLLNTVSLQ